MITRFAPSPTGPLHLGHAYSAILAHDLAVSAGGRFLLRIEDIDRARARTEWEALIYEDLAWLGLRWETPVLRQSDRLDAYRDALQQVWDRGYLYPCTCTRRDVREALSAPHQTGPDGPVYPGTCKGVRTADDGRALPQGVALRLHMDRAVADCRVDGEIGFDETGRGPDGERGAVAITARDAVERIGDVVLARAEFGTSYHLSVVVDDAAQGVTDVVRGQDLFAATPIHVVLQRLLGLPTPTYRHHRLIRDETGKRLAKRDDARALRLYRAEGATPADIRAMVGLEA